MWPWMKRWRDWATREFWPLTRHGPQTQALHYSYEKAGLVIADQPVPWCAEAVVVEALMRLPPSTGRRKGDFTLRVADGEVPAEQLRRAEGEDRYRVSFRLSPPSASTSVDLLFRGQGLGKLTIPFLSQADFLASLRLEMPTLFVRLGGESVACQTFVTSQCRGLLASGLLTSPTSLVPLLDLDLQVEFRCERTGSAFRVPVALCSSQLTARQALLSVVPRRYPRKIGTWVATWLVGERALASQRARGISQRAFQRSLRISDTRLVVQGGAGEVCLTRQMPTGELPARVGPCFLVASTEPGMAGMCRLRVTAQVPGAVRPPLLLEQVVLITDGPTMVAPGTVDAADLAQVSGFELTVGQRSLGALPLSPVPSATFTAEGGFRPPADYQWTPAAEEEMTERLNRLLDGGLGM